MISRTKQEKKKDRGAKQKKENCTAHQDKGHHMDNVPNTPLTAAERDRFAANPISFDSTYCFILDHLVKVLLSRFVCLPMVQIVLHLHIRNYKRKLLRSPNIQIFKHPQPPQPLRLHLIGIMYSVRSTLNIICVKIATRESTSILSW